MTRFIFSLSGVLLLSGLTAQSSPGDSTPVYKKRVLETTEIDFLSSYYSQDGTNAAVSGGIGTESLTDATATIVVAIPLNDDDVLTIDAGISAYTSASSSNINPFDTRNAADAFIASSGESQSDTWTSGVISYSHSSDDRNQLWSAKLSIANEYDYRSLGLGGSYSRLWNEKNTELSLHGNVYLDGWSLIYPIELRAPSNGNGEDEDHFNIANYTITGNADYQPAFVPLSSKKRNSYALGAGLSQILSRNLQGLLVLDLVLQNGLLSTPFQRVYFNDVDDSFIADFHLADDIERLPDSRFKTAVGGRLNYYLNEFLTVRTFYRYYRDDWGIQSHTASIEVPIKVMLGKLTFYPSYRFYNQTAADYFQPYDQHLSTETFYTSDYDLSNYTANQYGFGVSYVDIFNSLHLAGLGLKSVDLKYYHYERNTAFRSDIVTLGLKLVTR